MAGGNTGQSVAVVKEIERHDRRKPGQQHDLPAFSADRRVDGGERCVVGDPALDPSASQVAPDQKGEQRPDRARDRHVDRTVHDAVDESRTQRDHTAGHEQHGCRDVHDDVHRHADRTLGVDPGQDTNEFGLDIVTEKYETADSDERGNDSKTEHGSCLHTP